MKRVVCLFVVAWAVSASARELHSKEDADNDVYMNRVLRDCKEAHSKLSCFKYRAMQYVQQVTSDSTSSTQIWGPISIVKTPPMAIPEEEPTKAELQPRAAESELERMYKFADRQLDRFASTHALALTLDSGEEEGGSVGRAEKDVLGGRGKKKKGLRILLPLLLLVKIKLIALVTLLLVAGIKKLLVVAMLLAPLFLAKFKLAALAHQAEPAAVVLGGPPHHEHHHTASVDYGGGSEGYGAYPYAGWGSYRRQGPSAYGSQEAKP